MRLDTVSIKECLARIKRRVRPPSVIDGAISDRRASTVRRRVHVLPRGLTLAVRHDSAGHVGNGKIAREGKSAILARPGLTRRRPRPANYDNKSCSRQRRAVEPGAKSRLRDAIDGPDCSSPRARDYAAGRRAPRPSPLRRDASRRQQVPERRRT